MALAADEKHTGALTSELLDLHRQAVIISTWVASDEKKNKMANPQHSTQMVS